MGDYSTYGSVGSTNTQVLPKSKMLLHPSERKGVRPNTEGLKKSYTENVRISDGISSDMFDILNIANESDLSNFYKTTDRILASSPSVNTENYENEYISNFLQLILQTTLFNRNVGGIKQERWQTGPQKFYKYNKEEIDNIIYEMSEFTEELSYIPSNIQQLNDRVFAVLGAAGPTMETRIRYALQSVSPNTIAQDMVVLTSNRQVYNNTVISNIQNFSNINDVIDNEKKLKLTPEQLWCLKQYRDGGLFLKDFLDDYNRGDLTEDAMAQIVIEDFRNRALIPANVNISTLETTRTKGQPRANTTDTVETLVRERFGGNENRLNEVIFFTNQPHLTSQFSQLRARFGDNIIMNASALNNSPNNPTLIMQNLAGSFNSYYRELLEKNPEVLDLIGMFSNKNFIDIINEPIVKSLIGVVGKYHSKYFRDKVNNKLFETSYKTAVELMTNLALFYGKTKQHEEITNASLNTINDDEKLVDNLDALNRLMEEKEEHINQVISSANSLKKIIQEINNSANKNLTLQDRDVNNAENKHFIANLNSALKIASIKMANEQNSSYNKTLQVKQKAEANKIAEKKKNDEKKKQIAKRRREEKNAIRHLASNIDLFTANLRYRDYNLNQARVSRYIDKATKANRELIKI